MESWSSVNVSSLDPVTRYKLLRSLENTVVSPKEFKKIDKTDNTYKAHGYPGLNNHCQI